MTRRTSDIQAVIFDMDGLMFDTERIAIQAWQRAGEACGCEIARSLLRQCVGRNAGDTRALLQKALGPSFDYHRARALRVQYAEEMIEEQGVPIKEGLFELLEVLESHGALKAVATSTELTRAEAMLKRARVFPRFEAIVYGDEVERGKPAPDIFLRAAERLQVIPDKCLVLEDSEMGVRAAAQARMRVIMVPDLIPPSPEILPLLKRVLPDLHAVAAYVPEMVAAR